VYDRLVKNLAYLRSENLLKSKDYGLGKENLWSLKAGKALAAVQDEFDSPLVAPRAEIHSFKYEHEKACADVFVALALSGKLYSWKAHTRISKVIPDRTAELDYILHIEVEMGSQDKIQSKADQYVDLYRQTREPFHVLFLVQTDKQLASAQQILAGFSRHYRTEKLSDFCSDTSSELEDQTTSVNT
jgi:hypothetical protein